MIGGAELLGRRRRSTPIPSAIGWAPEGGIQDKGIGASARSYMIPLASTTLRYVRRGASGTGASSASPRGTIWQELNALSGPTTILVESSATAFDLSNGSAGSVFVDSCNLIAVDNLDTLTPGNITIAMSAPLTWAAAGGGAYSATMAGAYAFAPYAVIDEAVLDAAGAGAWLTPVADLAAVQATAGSWAKVGTVIYVRTSDSRSPDANVHVMKDASALATVFAGKLLYVEGVKLLGGTRCVRAQIGTSATLARCTLRYGRIGGVSFQNLARATMLDCNVAGNGADGIEYTNTTRGLEVGVTSSRNGDPITPGNIHNGSTAHGACSIIRVDGTYLDNQGPNLADVLAAKSLNVRCRASGSTATQSTQRVGVWSQGAVWLDRCDVTGNPELDLKAQDVGNTIVHYSTRFVTAGGDGVAGIRAGRG